MDRSKKRGILILSIFLIMSVCGVFCTSIKASALTKDEAVKWLEEQQHVGYDVNGDFSEQCSDFASAYMNWVVTGDPQNGRYGINHAINYKQIANADSANWEIIDNYASFVPLPGDIFVSTGLFPQYGHIGVVISSDVNNARIVDQNSEYPNLTYGCPAWVHHISWTGLYAPKYFIRYKHFTSVVTGSTMSAGAGRTIPDGDYQLITGVNANMTLDVPGDTFNVKGGENIEIWEGLNRTCDIFTFTYLNDGYYKITLKGTDYSLDVADSGKQNGVNVILWKYHGGDNQKWSISHTGDGWYRIQSKVNGFSLDVDNGVAENGRNVQMWTNNDSNAQKWRVGGIQMTKGAGQTIQDGDYYFVTGVDPNMTLDVPGDSYNVKNSDNAEIWEGRYRKYDIFTVKYLNNGFYKIIHKGSGKCLDAQNFLTYIGTNVQYYEDNGTIAQQWSISNTGGCYYRIQAKCSGFSLDVDGGVAKNGRNVRLYPNNDAAAQKWELIPAGVAIGKIIDNGNYHIISALDNTKAICIEQDVLINGEKYNNVVLSSDIYNKDNVFSLIYNPVEGNYCIKHKATGMNLDLQKAGQSENTGVWTGDDKGGTNGLNQDWIIKESGEAYNIISQQHGTFLDVKARKAVNGANILTSPYVNADSQKWIFVKAVDNITLDVNELSMKNGESKLLNVKIVPDNAANKQVEWMTDNSSVVKVNQQGEVTAVGVGTATITAASKDCSQTAFCKITVTDSESEVADNEFEDTDSNKEITEDNSNDESESADENKIKDEGVQENENSHKVKERKSDNKDSDDNIDDSKENIADDSEDAEDVERIVKAPGKVTLNSLKKGRQRSFTAKWKNITNAKGYELQYANNKKFTKAKSKKNISGTTVKISKLKKKKTYYVRVRAYVIDSYGNKLYGKWSKIKKIKIK